MQKFNSIINNVLGYTLDLSFQKKKGARERLRYEQQVRNIFEGQLLVYSDSGYWELKPGIDEKLLEEYYLKAYWGSRGGKVGVVTNRDLHHFQMIRELAPDVFERKKPRLMNFGSGHGGVSHLFRACGWGVVNVEPSNAETKIGNQEWTNGKSLESLDAKVFDLIYGSHSLEHVASIKDFQSSLARFVKKGETLAFWEVPNADCPSNGAQHNLIDIPHTYYFQKRFFQSWLGAVVFIESFGHLGEDFLDWKSNQKRDGEVIRALGFF